MVREMVIRFLREEVHRILEEEKLAELKKFLDKEEIPMGKLLREVWDCLGNWKNNLQGQVITRKLGLLTKVEWGAKHKKPRFPPSYPLGRVAYYGVWVSHRMVMSGRAHRRWSCCGGLGIWYPLGRRVPGRNQLATYSVRQERFEKEFKQVSNLVDKITKVVLKE
ncbi:hypothetical protein N7519_011477 [Penicillium mononematosum]|uniref:uncharacterized protein n=1 Tax=Penicillium mononematosum TaxID=268346 RepID=UPI002549436A|nr:uncharacterized protein N7519_011477 [Penicillium mononematosum]KAJ6181016.1 hypothetical protein N7519_011477 [Penicillium mononematosum]